MLEYALHTQEYLAEQGQRDSAALQQATRALATLRNQHARLQEEDAKVRTCLPCTTGLRIALPELHTAALHFYTKHKHIISCLRCTSD